MGIVRAIQKGEAPAGKFSKAAQKAAKSMKKSSVKKYAKTKHDDLPVKKEALSASQFKAAHKKFKDTGELPPHLKKLAKDLDKVKAKHKVKNIVVPGLEWMSKIKEAVNEQQKRQATDIRRRYDNAYLKFEKEVNNVIKMVDKYQGDKTDGKIIAKQFKKSLTPLDDLMQSWTAGQYRNPNISESINESEEKKIEKLLLKYGNNKKDTKGIMKWYGRVSKMYKKANPAKKAQIMNSLWGQNEGTCGYGEDGKLGDKPAGPHLLKKKVQEISNSEAKTLLQQLGGRRFMMMVGAKNLGRDNKGLHMKIGRNSKSISHVVINYNRGKDLYDMKFLRVRKGKVKVVNKVLGVYADQLNNTFEKNTGLYTRM